MTLRHVLAESVAILHVELIECVYNAVTTEIYLYQVRSNHEREVNFRYVNERLILQQREVLCPN